MRDGLDVIETRPADTERTCGDCWLFTPLLCDGEPPRYGWCGIDGEGVRADNPACSVSPTRQEGRETGD